jgi:hypothetical protein
MAFPWTRSKSRSSVFHVYFSSVVIKKKVYKSPIVDFGNKEGQSVNSILPDFHGKRPSRKIMLIHSGILIIVRSINF